MKKKKNTATKNLEEQKIEKKKKMETLKNKPRILTYKNYK